MLACLAGSKIRHGNTMLLQGDRVRKLKLHFGARTNTQCTNRNSMPCPSRRARPTCWLNAMRFYRDIVSVYRDRRKLQS
jgi:hypothetical protein